MYSFQPVTSYNNYGEVIIMCIMLLGLSIGLGWLTIESIKGRGLRHTSFAGILACVFTLILGYTEATKYKEPPTPKNEKVTAEFIDFVAEGYSYSERSGKQTTKKDVSLIYVKYKLMDNSIVLLPASKGQPYPKKVVLYKN